MMKVMSVIMMMVFVKVMKVRVHAEEQVFLNTSHFDALCNLTKAMTGLLQNFVDDSPESEAIFKKEGDIRNKIDEIFFGEKRKADGYWILPDKFTKGRPKRSAICGSMQDRNSHMPLPKDSLASVFLCLCTPIKGGREDLCGLKIDNNGDWPVDNSNNNVEKVFKEVWGDLGSGLILEKCGKGGESESIAQALERLKANVTVLGMSLENKGGKFDQSKKCDFSEENACSIVTKTPSWMEKFKEIEDITHLALMEAEKEKLAQKAEKAKAELISEVASTAASGQAPEPTDEAISDSVTSKGNRNQPKQEPVEAPEEKQNAKPMPEPEEKPGKMPQNREEKTENNLPLPEPNETSRSLPTIPKWSLLGALL